MLPHVLRPQHTSPSSGKGVWMKVLERIHRVLDVDVAILIAGVGGTGKEFEGRTSPARLKCPYQEL